MKPDAAETLLARQKICEALARYCRTLDRLDKDGARALWRKDARAVYHGMYEGTGHGFVDWVWERHHEMRSHFHQLGNILIEVDGEEAASEAYVTVTLRPQAPETPGPEIQALGRYLDRWRCEQGVWRIAEREFILDAQSTRTPQATEASLVSARGRSDPSYEFLSS